MTTVRAQATSGDGRTCADGPAERNSGPAAKFRGAAGSDANAKPAGPAPARAGAWRRVARDWPHAGHSRFLRAAGIAWHVQVMGEGPALLLLHGTGASAHSWRGLAPQLCERHTIVAPDLPGQGYTEAMPSGNAGMCAMSGALEALLAALGEPPAAVIGHSAGAAIAARMVLDGRLAPRSLVSLNGALLPFTGIPGRVFKLAARGLAMQPWLPPLFAWRARRGDAVERLIESTGSRLDERGVDLYRRLIGDPRHVAGTLDMMAAWDLPGLARELPRLDLPVHLVVGEQDGTVPPQQAERLAKLLPNAGLVRLSGLGHLAHEEAPRRVAALIGELLGRRADGAPP